MLIGFFVPYGTRFRLSSVRNTPPKAVCILGLRKPSVRSGQVALLLVLLGELSALDRLARRPRHDLSAPDARR